MQVGNNQVQIDTNKLKMMIGEKELALLVLTSQLEAVTNERDELKAKYETPEKKPHLVKGDKAEKDTG